MPAQASGGDELARLREMDAFRTRFLNMAAHELNTPLTPLRLQLHLLGSGGLGPLTEKQSRAVGVASRNVGRLSAVVKEILDVARMEGGGLRYKIETFRIGDAVTDAMESFEEAARVIGVHLRADVPPDLAVRTDRQRLTQVFLNLVSNALKFTPKDGVVSIHARVRGDEIVLDVKDTGAGLRPDQIQRLFQPFTQVHDAVMTTEGTGLGLYICRGLLDPMGGAIEALSDGPGRGSTFRVTLPLSHEIVSTVPRLPVPAVNSKEAAAARMRELI